MQTVEPGEDMKPVGHVVQFQEPAALAVVFIGQSEQFTEEEGYAMKDPGGQASQ